MRLKIISFFLVFFFGLQINSIANINDKILAKIGNEIITNYDIINEINTILALSNKPANEKDFKNLQGIAFTSLKKILIKKAEIEKYKITKYSQSDVNNYISGLEQNLNLKNVSLKEHFKRYGANYDFVLILKYNY